MVVLFGGLSSGKIVIDKQNFEKIISGNKPFLSVVKDSTPVYESGSKRQLAVLESAFPGIAANFSTIFPLASKPLWIKEGREMFVYFVFRGLKGTAVFSSKGQMKYAVYSINPLELPKPIQEKVNTDYRLYSFMSAKKILAGIYTAFEVIVENCHEYITISTTDDDSSIAIDIVQKTSTSSKCTCKVK